MYGKRAFFMILWGWSMFLHVFITYLNRVTFTTFIVAELLELLVYLPIPMALAVTAWTWFKKYKFTRKSKGFIIFYVWFATFLSFVLVNLILFNVLNTVNYEVQHSLFMLMSGFALIVNGYIIKYRWLTFGGVFFVMAAYIASLFQINYQLLIEAFTWVIALAGPGHILFIKQQGFTV